MTAAGDGRSARLVVALDVPSSSAALALAGALPEGTWCKVGLELFARAGPDVVERLRAAGHPVFLDLKLHDIPNTVAGAVRAAAALDVELLTVHAVGGAAMLAAAAEAAEAAEAAGDGTGGRLRLLAVTVLTSLDDAALEQVAGPGAGVAAAAERLATLAAGNGIDGVVASVAECAAIKARRGSEFLVATPGIRVGGQSAHDQARVATPAAAVAAGSDYLVVGRAITAAPDPATALARIRAEMMGAAG